MPFFDRSVYSNLSEVSALGADTVLCIDERTKRLYVKKTVDASFLGLYEKISSIDSNSISRIRYISDCGDTVDVVRDYISGNSIGELIKDGVCFDTKRVCSVALQVCDGLSLLHGIGLVHRDISANNILITHGGTAVIIDYGIARSFETGKNSDTVILGTPGYAAPEQFGFRQSDARTDIYAVGVLMNVMLTGKLPSEEKAGGQLGRIIDKCIRIDPKKRYSDVKALKKALLMIYDRGNSTLSSLPGFRGSGFFYVARTVVLYLTMFLLTLGMLGDTTVGARSYAFSVLSWVLIIALPYLLIGNPFDLRDRLLGKDTDAGSKKSFSYVLSSIMIIVGIILFGSI